MSRVAVVVTFERELSVPEDCFEHADLACTIIHHHCEIVCRSFDLLSFRVKLLIKFVARRGGLRCSFKRTVVIDDCAWVDGVDVMFCEVKKAICKCVLKRGRARCAGAVFLRFRVHSPF